MSRPTCEHPGCGNPGIIETVDLKEAMPEERASDGKLFRRWEPEPVARHRWCREHEQPPKRYLLDGTVEQDVKEQR